MKDINVTNFEVCKTSIYYFFINKLLSCIKMHISRMQRITKIYVFPYFIINIQKI